MHGRVPLKSHGMTRGPALWLALLLLLPLYAHAQPARGARDVATAELRTVQYFESVRAEPSLLWGFLRKMPKGGDLHSHLSGAVYAETYVQWAADDGLCVEQKTMALSAAPCDAAAGRPPASAALSDSQLYGRMIDAWSIRNLELSGRSGHDHFFEAFGKFGAISRGRTGEMLAEVASRAAAERVSYLEVMLTTDGGRASMLGALGGWDDDLKKLRERLLAGGLREAIAAGRESLNEAEAKQRATLRCGTPQADAGCRVTVRYISQVGRAAPRQQVFAQMLAAFEMASADRRVVGLNLVQPEDGYVAMRDFSLHMRMLDFLHRLYPGVHITLHAGELAPGLVPPEGLRSHVRESVARGHAERIGHAVSVMYEDDPLGMLRELSRRNVMVEVCLTSNDVILGVRGKYHPLSMFLKYGVPVALATDDPGVARSEMWREYLKAVDEHALGYTQLKTMARTSLEHAFLTGASLWADARKFTTVPQCVGDRPGGRAMSAACRRFISGSDRAKVQWELEEAISGFESEYGR